MLLLNPVVVLKQTGDRAKTLSMDGQHTFFGNRFDVRLCRVALMTGEAIAWILFI